MKNGNIIIRDNEKEISYWRTINLTCLLDSKLSWKAKGLFNYLSTRPDGWKINQKDLIKRAKDNVFSLRSATKELERYGYLKIKMTRDKNNRIQYEYLICRNPK